MGEPQSISDGIPEHGFYRIDAVDSYDIVISTLDGRRFNMNRRYPTSPTYPGIPTPKAIQLAILQHVADRKEYGFGKIYADMVVYFELPPELEGKTFPGDGGDNQLPASGKNVFYKYCNGACRELVRKEWLEDVGGGGFYEDRIYRITHRGLEQVDQESVSTDCSVPHEQELSHFVVILGDGRTRITRQYDADVFADVVAILGLKRISQIYPDMVSTEERYQYGYNARKRGNYWVCFHGAKIEKKARLEVLAEKLGVDLTVKINDEVTR